MKILWTTGKNLSHWITAELASYDTNYDMEYNVACSTCMLPEVVVEACRLMAKHGVLSMQLGNSDLLERGL